jgi:hypothetical protein
MFAGFESFSSKVCRHHLRTSRPTGVTSSLSSKSLPPLAAAMVAQTYMLPQPAGLMGQTIGYSARPFAFTAFACSIQPWKVRGAEVKPASFIIFVLTMIGRTPV